MKNALKNLISRAQKLFDTYKQELLNDLPQEFGIQVDDVIDYKIEGNGVETGIIISGQKRYRYEITSDKTALDELKNEN